jgi:hypothetical protein
VTSIRSPRTARTSAGAVRLARAAAAAILAAALLAGPAHANLGAAGPVNPATGYPDWYQDADGLKLQLCVDGPPLCSAAGADLVAPDGEGFWWRAQADVAIGGGAAKMALAQEAAFVNNDRVTFGRVRVVIVGAGASTTYTVRHPYGTLTITTDGIGNGRSSTDIGCGGAPCAWSGALGTEIGPFLHWDPTVAPAPQPGYIGDAATPHRVVGSPTGFNGFSVTGGGATASADLEGKLAGPPVPVINAPAAMDFGATTPKAPVTRSITITSFGVPDAGGASNLGFGAIGITGPSAGAFSLVGNTCSGRALPSGATCALTVVFNPGAAGAAGASLGLLTNTATGAAHIALTGTGVVPGPNVLGARASAARRLVVSRLRTTHRVARARVLRRGLRLTMRLPQGTEIVKIAVYRVRKGKVLPKPVWLGYRVPSRAGLYRLRLDSRIMRRRLKAGVYQVNVTPGLSRHELGRTVTTRIRITRR